MPPTDQRWRSPIGAEVLAARGQPMVGDRARADNRLIALNPRDGGRRWVYQRNNPPLALRTKFAGVVLRARSSCSPASPAANSP